MVSQQLIDIIIRAEDKASQTAKKVDDTFKKLGNKGSNAFDKVNTVSEKTNQKINKTVSLVNKVGTEGSKSFQKLSKSQQDAVTKFHTLDKVTQNTLKIIDKLGMENKHLIPGANDAIKQFQNLDKLTTTWQGSLDYAKSKMQLLGNNTNTLRGKIQTTGMAIQTYLGTKWDVINTKISSVSNNIKGKIGSAIDLVKTKINSLRGSFDKGLTQGADKAGKSLGFLRSAASMTVGMIGYDLVNGFIESGRAALNANNQLEYFGKRLNLSSERTEKFNSYLEETQKKFKKVNMKAVGASAEELAVKLNLPKNSLEATTETIAVMSSAFVKEGRTQEDAILAVSDALDGQFKRMLELGITQDELKNNGWDGDLKNKTGLLKAMNRTLDEMGFTQTAMDITNLDEAYQALTVSGGRLIEKVLVPLTPLLMGIIDGVMGAIDVIMGVVDSLMAVWNSLPDWAKYAIEISAFALAVGLLVSYLGGLPGILMSIGSILGPIIGLIGGISLPLIAIVGLIAAVVVAVYELGKAFGWWDNIGDVFAAIQTNVMRLWDAFINNPDVQGLIHGIGDAWNWLLEVSKPVIDWLKGIWVEIFPESTQDQWDVTRAIIDGVGFAFQVLTIPIKAVITVLQILYPYMEQFYNTVLVPLGGFLQTVFTPVWQLLGEVISAIMPFVMSLSDAFTQFMNGQIGLPELISSIFMNLISIYATALGTIMKSILNFAVSSVSKGVNAAINFVGGILYNISMLPSRVAMYLLNVVSRIISAGVQWVSAASSKASEVVSAVLSPISSLPGKVYNEFMQIGSRIMSAGSDLVNKAKNIGKNIVDGILGAMGIHSPGDIQEGIVAEFVNTIVRVKSQVKSAYDTAKEMGSAFVDGFGNPNLDVETLSNKDNLIRDLDTPTMNVGVNLDTANNDVINSYNTLATNTGASLQSMIDNDKNAYELIRNNDSSQLSAITSNLSSNMNTMSSKVKTSLDNMLNKNKIGLNTARNTTKTQLNSITSATVKANQKMISSWNTMKNGIVSAADKIKSDSTTHFKGLESTIGNFYRKLQNPGGFGAGPGGKVSSIKRNSGNGFKRIANVIRKYNMPESLTLGEVKRNPFISTANIGSYIQSSHGKFNVSDLIRTGNIKIPIGLEDPFNLGKGAGWSDNTDKHVSKIKDKSKNWSMKGPKIIGKYATSIGFKVKDFLNGVPKIDFATFKQMAQDVFSQCHYDFYYDSNKYGNWMTAFQHGAMNCSDSTDALIAFAQACGLPASKVHGHWGKVGHFWANIAGHKMDTTGWMNQRNWTPSQSHAGPAPKGYSFIDVIEELKNTSNEKAVIVENNTDENDRIIILDGEVKIIHEFENLPEGITAEDVARLINETTSSDNWIKALIKNIKFQKWDLKEKLRIEKQNKRSKGV